MGTVQQAKAQRKRQARQEALQAEQEAAQKEERLRELLSTPRKLTVAGIEAAVRGQSRYSVEGLTTIRQIAEKFKSEQDRADFGAFLVEVFHQAPKLIYKHLIPAFSRIFAMSGDWRRPLSDWTPRGYSIASMYRSLVEHLFIVYPVPHFLYTAFTESDDEVLLFCHLASGGSVQAAVKSRLLPVCMTHKMAHIFMNTPSGYAGSIREAVRMAQVRALGGTVRVAKAICGSFLLSYQRDEAFWLTVIQWCCSQENLDPQQIAPLLDYIRRQKDANPAFQMKGRSALALFRGMEEWHRELARQKAHKYDKFKPSGFKGCSWDLSRVDSHGNVIEPRLYTLTEILTAKELAAEGREMRHCVYSYAHSIDTGKVSIWSLRLDENRVLTVEVDNHNRLVVQARGRFNKMADPSAQRLITQWAQKAGLFLGGYLWNRAW